LTVLVLITGKHY